ncbi:MAG: GNAT family N-acetyltransferase [Ardenticatenaceae bacterium]
MKATITIQPATPQDALGIASVQARVWPSEQADMARITDVLQDATHTTLVALANKQVVGFVDCFETRPASGIRRWEIDLIAVDPDFHRRGVGTRLMAGANAAGHARGITVARAFVATSNIASQRTFARCGYQSDWIKRDLYICNQPPTRSTKVGRPQEIAPTEGLIPVSTLRYRGWWIEERWTLERLSAAQDLLHHQESQVVGAVIPLHQPAAIQAAKQAGYFFVGQFHWWKMKP